MFSVETLTQAELQVHKLCHDGEEAGGSEEEEGPECGFRQELAL